MFRITKKPLSETRVKNRVICHRFSMALNFHDQCQFDSKTQYVLSGKWCVFTDKLLKSYRCPQRNVLIRTKCTDSHFVRKKGRFYGQKCILAGLSVERRTLRTGFLMTSGFADGYVCAYGKVGRDLRQG